jgi:hypothetical protein
MAAKTTAEDVLVGAGEVDVTPVQRDQLAEGDDRLVQRDAVSAKRGGEEPP